MLTPELIEGELEKLANNGYCPDPVDLLSEALTLLTPPEDISTTQCAARFRKFPAPQGAGTIDWSPTLTPYINDIQDALDDPRVSLVVVIKPGRVGGTVAAENHLFKRMKFGPLTDTLWYLASDSEVDAYVDNVMQPMFDLHSDMSAKVGSGRSDNKRTFKRIAGRKLEILPINRKTITNRQAGFIFVDEIDSVVPRLRGTMISQIKTRGRALGSRFKGYVCSHPDAGWGSGVGAAYKETNRGIWYWPCPHCGGHSSPAPTAKFRTHLTYERPDGVTDDEFFAIVAATAALSCPHCGSDISDEFKAAMLEARRLVFAGQDIDPDGRVTGEPVTMAEWGAWIHGTMSPFVRYGELAKEFESARRHFERTRKPERLREVTAKVLGEIYGGDKAGSGELAPEKLQRRADEGFALGTVPAGPLFVTASVDPGGAKFDVGFWGWDLEGRSWLIDRVTLKQRRWADGVMRDLRPAERIDDWMVLRDEVLDRLLPLADDPTQALPVAAMAIDTGDGHVTWLAREFARRMSRQGRCWGQGANRWERVRLIKGAKLATAPELPVTGRPVSKDEEGRAVTPVILEWDLGVHKLKELSVERLAVTDGGPGQCYFANGLPASTFAEFTGEVLVDGAWDRRGPNESLDLFGYAEAARLMLRPDRADIRWDTRLPIWARPVRLVAEEANPPVGQPTAQQSKQRSIFERIDERNRTQRRND